MASKPSEGHIEWITDNDPDKYIAPSDAKRLQGWIKEEKPPFQYFNWFFRLVDRWLKWAEAQIDENIVTIVYNMQSIANEATTRANADNALQDNIDAEASARADADNALQSNIDAEASARASADSTLQGNIDAEATARTSGDNTLQSNINAEATARANADSAHAALTNAHGATSANTASRIVMRDGAGDVIGRLFRTEYASVTAGLPYFLGQAALGAGVDNYARPMSVSQAKAVLGMNYSSFGRVNSYETSSISIDGDLNTVDLGTVTEGDVFIATAQAEFNTSGSDGTVEILLSKYSGTATVAGIGSSNPTFSQGCYVPTIALNIGISVTGVFVVTGSGTLVMQSEGNLNHGSSATAEQRKLEVVWLKKQ